MEYVEQRDAEAFVGWLVGEVLAEARGDGKDKLDVPPSGRFWLGRLAPQQSVEAMAGERGERLEPCEMGVRVRPSEIDGRDVRCQVRFVVWTRAEVQGDGQESWEKHGPAQVDVKLSTPTVVGQVVTGGSAEFASAFDALKVSGMAAEVHAELEEGMHGPELVVTVVNTTTGAVAGGDANLYEVELRVEPGSTVPFVLDELDDSFRYDRRVPAYGVNCGVEKDSSAFVTRDLAVWDQRRAAFWDPEAAGPEPALEFELLASDPLPPLQALVQALKRWGEKMWSPEVLDRRATVEGWTNGMRKAAVDARLAFLDELRRLDDGLELLRRDSVLRRAFMLANEAFARGQASGHRRWRPFQVGFILANLAALSNDPAKRETNIVDILWFPTGGGKTETYLLLILTAAFHDRLRGKAHGITAWVRFPLRMLSLQQTQRFADALAGAELVRRSRRVAGAPFSLGFLVGQASTPNTIPPKGTRDLRHPDMDDPEVVSRFQVLIRCPFCGSEDLKMRFDERRWTLDHLCEAPDCPSQGHPLPIRVVDDEIYRFLPTVVVGTLDKAASVSIQAAMRGLYASPLGRCPLDGHGYTYAPRSDRPTGCLFPGCKAKPEPLNQSPELFPPTFRLQDELHLLRDSLGAVDSHYEALLDQLQQQLSARPKIVASSATLSGYETQVRELYRRGSRYFPQQGPVVGQGFWLKDSDQVARRFVGLAPRGATLEYATDQLVETLQRSVRKAITDPDAVARATGVPGEHLPALVWAYGVDVVYGSTLKDVEAAARSFESQVRVPVNGATLTGRTPFEEVRRTLERLTNPEPSFEDRIHVVAASSMLSHGVDVDRLNVMVMLGLPLSTAEFIQTTSRVGRKHPGLVFVLHKMARERDAAVFRTFPAFVRHADRLIDPIPITSKSRRVLELTFPGLVLGRVYGYHEPRALEHGLKALTTPEGLQRAFARMGVDEGSEREALEQLLDLSGVLDEGLRDDLREYLRDFLRKLYDPTSRARFVTELFPAAPMLSLRDVEDQVPVQSRGDTR